MHSRDDPCFEACRKRKFRWIYNIITVESSKYQATVTHPMGRFVVVFCVNQSITAPQAVKPPRYRLVSYDA